MGTRSVKGGLVIPKANPGINWSWIVNLIVTVLKPIVGIVTPIIREELEKALLKLYAKAEASDNPWDDFLVEILLKILGIPVPEGE